MNKPPTILVIIGITGDLAKRKLLPAIERIAAAGELPEAFSIVGVTRRDVSAHDVLDSLPKHHGHAYVFVSKHLRMFKMDLADQSSYDALKEHLTDIEKSFGSPAQRLFYLSVPPQVSQVIVECLGQTGFGRAPSTKLLLEKPFGSDLTSAQELVKHIKAHFTEDQVYRIDHYLAKEMAQNILVFRVGNSLLKRTWNKDFIERIEIIASEKIGIEGRAVFYEQTGALRDVVQSHLLQLAALTLMDLPDKSTWSDVPKQRLAALQSLHLPSADELAKVVTRGQYEGYREEVGNPHSATETFISLTLFSNSSRWQNVPVTLTAGKALHDKYTEVRIHYRQEDAGEANQLTLRIQPKEGIEFALWSKRPGYSRDMERVQLQFNYHEQAESLPEAYEQVFLDAIRSDHTLFTFSDEVLASWRILEPIQRYWSLHSDDLILYKPGSQPDDIKSL